MFNFSFKIENITLDPATDLDPDPKFNVFGSTTSLGMITVAQVWIQSIQTSLASCNGKPVNCHLNSFCEFKFWCLIDNYTYL